MITRNAAENRLRFRLLQTGNEFFDEMLRAIESARISIRLEMYTYTSSLIGERCREGLRLAAERGVKVMVLVDSWGSITLADSFWEPVRNAGGEVRWFNPFGLRRYSIRNHRKLLVFDDQIALIGGFNIAEEYVGDGVNRGWRDCGAYVEGPLAKELALSFDTMFALADFEHKRFIRLRKARDHRFISTKAGQIILIGPGRGRNLLKKSLLEDLKRASNVRIISAYFVPTRSIRRALTRAARRGCKVQFILAAKSDVPIMLSASRRFYHSYLKAGIEIYEYQPQILHAKLVIADDAVYLGSANLDRRSFYINYELVVRVPDRDFAADAEAVFREDLSRCQKIEAKTWRQSRTFWSKLKERWAYFLIARLDPLIARRQLKGLR